MAVRLPDLVLQVPHLLQTIHAESLGPLVATCTELRQHVHQYVTRICVPYGCDMLLLATLDLSNRPVPSMTAARYLSSHPWPQLKVLDLDNSSLGPAGIAQLVQSNLASLQYLRLQGNKLGSAGIQQLIKGNWAQLISLDLQCNYMNAAALSELTSASWSSLQSLSLSRNRLSAEAVAQLQKGSWP